MAAMTTTRAGNWFNTTGGVTPWTALTGSGPGGVPGAGDTVIGSHNLHIDGLAVVGHSPGAGDSVAALKMTGSATLTIDADCGLECRGDLVLEDVFLTSAANMTMEAGSYLEFNAANASVPSTAKYVLKIGTSVNYAAFVCRLTINGTSWADGDRVDIRSNASGANASIGYDGTHGGNITGTFLRGTRMGDSSVAAWKHYGTKSSSLTDAEWIASGDTVVIIAVGSNLTFNQVRVKHVNSVGTYNLTGSYDGAIGTGSRNITGCVFDRALLVNVSGATVDGNYFGGGQPVFTGTGWASHVGNVYVMSGGSHTTTQGNYSGNIVIFDAASTNPHMLGFGANMNGTGSENIYVFTDKDAAGDCLVCGNPGSARTYIEEFSMFLANGKGDCSGTPFTLGAGANVTLKFRHNTYVIGTQGAAVGETYIGHAGLVGEFLDNIAHDTSARGFKLYDSGSDDSVSDLVSSANCDYNGGWNFLTGSNLKGYDKLEFSSGSPGAHDIDADPLLFDATRRPETFAKHGLGLSASAWATATGYVVGDLVEATTTGWYGSLPVIYRCKTAHTSNSGHATNGKPGDGDNTTAWRTNWEFASLYYLREAVAQSPGYNAAATIEDCWNWIAEGQRTQQPLYRNSGSDGLTRGAMEYVAPSTGRIGIGDLFGNIFGNVFGDLEPPITGY